MATTYKSNQQLPSSVSAPITAQIAKIQAGINSLKSGSSSSSASSGSGGGSGSSSVGAVNAQGQIVDSSGKVIGAANPADRYSSKAVQAESVAPQTPIDTAQPSPATAQINPPNKSYTVAAGDTLSGIAKAQGVDMSQISGYKSGDPNKIGVGETLSISQQYRDAANLAKQTGAEVPQSAGAGMAGVGQFLQNTQGQQEEGPSIIGGIMETDSNFDSILTSYDDFMSPQTQRTSLLEEYQKLSQSLGIEGMNTELINAKRIIEGTEDDIRAEVISTGGMATDSQVLALANARNKSLVKNYNYLLESRDSAMTQLNTMMDLSIKDRQMAEAEFDRKMNFAFKVAEFKERAKSNATSNLQAIVSKVGYAGLLASTNGNAYEQSLIEKTLGLGQGGLNKLATLPPSEEEQLDLELKRSQLETDRLQRSNIQSQINDRSKPSTPKAPTADQLKVAGYKDRLIESDTTIQKLGSQFTGAGSYIKGSKFIPNILKSTERQQFEQAQRNFINAVLRRESGASIQDDEFNNAKLQYFPQPGDSAGTINQKAQNRRTVINSFARESSNVTSNFIVAPNGDEIEIID